MPTFDFECVSCGHVWEFSRPFGSDATPVCPECSGAEVVKLIAPPAIQFKGQGFYKTDSSSSAPKAPAVKAEESASAKAEATPTSGATPKTETTKTENAGEVKAAKE